MLRPCHRAPPAQCAVSRLTWERISASIGNPGVEKADFELWSLAVSAVNGCNHCLEAHEKTLREEGVDREKIFEAIRAASIVAGVAQAVEAGRVLDGASV